MYPICVMVHGPWCICERVYTNTYNVTTKMTSNIKQIKVCICASEREQERAQAGKEYAE